MGNMMKKNQGSVNAAPPGGGAYVPYPPQAPYGQQPQQGLPPQYMQQPSQPRPPMYPPQQSTQFRPPQSGGPPMSNYSGPPSNPPQMGQGPLSHYENDIFLSNLTGWSLDDIERLRHEFYNYANSFGVIDREGFLKLYIASLLNMTWDAVARDAEMAFRNFDVNQTGGLDFNEYITACSRMTREIQGPLPPPIRSNPIY